jgi:hypothetical protein
MVRQLLSKIYFRQETTTTAAQTAIYGLYEIQNILAQRDAMHFAFLNRSSKAQITPQLALRNI